MKMFENLARDKIKKGQEYNNLIWHSIVIGIGTFGSSLANGGLTILIPFYVKDILGSHLTNAATLFALGSLGGFLFNPIAGMLVAHTSCECIIIVSCVIHFIAQLCLYGSLTILRVHSSYFVWCIMCFIIGITSSLAGVSMETYNALHIPIHKRGRFMTYQVVISRLAYMFGAYSNGLLSIHLSIAITLLLNAIITIVFGIIIFLLFIPPNYHISSPSISSFADCARIWKAIGCRNRLQLKHWILKHTINEAQNEHNQHIDTMKDATTLSLYRVCTSNLGILCKLSVLCAGQLYARQSREFILTFQANSMRMNNKQITHINTYSYIPDIAVFFVPGYLMDKCGRKYSLIPSLLCLIIASACISFTDNYAQLVMVAVLLGLGDGLASGSLNTIASDIAPLDYNGRAKFVGIFYMICGIPGVLSPIIIGYLTSHISLFYASMSSVCFATISLIWTIFVIPETSKYHLMLSDDERLDEQHLSGIKETVQLSLLTTHEQCK